MRRERVAYLGSSPGIPANRLVSALTRARDAFAIGSARALGRLVRLVKAGEGASLPGIVSERLSPGFLRRRAGRLPGGIVVVSGTNGKTTTASMIRNILRAEGVEVIGNETGANLRQGIATALAEAPRDACAAVFEVDEAALGSLIPDLRPRILVLTNIFRDQMDRFGETERVSGMLTSASEHLPVGSRIVANTDDPMLWHSVADLAPVGFGVRLMDAVGSVPGRRFPSTEPETCPNCGGRLTYTTRTIVHLGVARCAACGFRSASPMCVAKVLERHGLRSIDLEVAGAGLTLGTGGIHNAYNAAAAVATADLLGIHPARATRALRSFRPCFGRGEAITVDGETVILALMKNPSGADALLEEVTGDQRIGSVVVSVNDAEADGRDISWIWDVDFECLGPDLPTVPSGTRCDDVAVRLKYAGARPAPASRDPLAAIRAALSVTPPSRIPVMLATYTAMLDVRSALYGRADRLHAVSS